MNKIEFLPERIRRHRAGRNRLVRSGYLLAACALTMAAHALARQQQIATARADVQALSGRADNVSRQVAMSAALEQQMARLLTRKRIDEELGNRADCTAALAELCRVMPANVVLVSLELKTVKVMEQPGGSGRGGRHRSSHAAVAKGRPAKPTASSRLRLTIVGVAPSNVDVANFIGQLSTSCLFEDVNMGYTRTVDFHDRRARQFQASCYLIG